MNSVLIIEDNQNIRDNVIEILELAGYKTYGTATGKCGIDLAIKHNPDIILCDIMMDGLDGYGVLYLLKKNPLTSMIPFVFITAKVERADMRKAMEMGADDYLTKPFDDMELLHAVESRLKKKDSEHDFYSKSLNELSSLVSKEDGLKELQNLVADKKGREFKKNQVIYYEGDKVVGIYLVLQGKIKTIMLAEDGRELMTGIFETDDFLGINVLLSNELYTDTATAIEDSSLCLIPKRQLDDLLHLYPEVAEKFIRILSKDIREKEQYLMQLAYHSVRKRIAEAILRLHRQNNDEGECIKITRDDLAAMSGTAPETVSRTLTEFRSEGLIEKTQNSLKILDMQAIVKMKN